MNIMFSRTLAMSLAAAACAPLQEQEYGLGPPPLAAEVTGDIEHVLVGPIHSVPYMCSEHPLGQVAYAGDALGTDCLVTGGLDAEPGFSRLYRGDGGHNEDWYGWRAEVLAPVSGTVLGIFAYPSVNMIGEMGCPPAGTIRIRSEDGMIVTLSHLGEFFVSGGDYVDRGMIIGLVGNNGVSRAPHIHVGAHREADATPLQIRWNLREMADLQAQQGDNEAVLP
ncbi:M23 family metallopeptidase [Qipengyuania aurantiaca]|uniref:M23 family metallopeptidase n=1 Tax=Qipengyuania aurantiaca TaxID=2867233 RepID=A0ABX8ZPW6_9SPHN|nr:M23 family metallopeptidase [Qipengyuania aurantiaca]QZD90984.1 M23 family metallopeptidase [Qipengyuania aurantiaca]